jgi:DNA repair protein RecO (recombination protein O)
MSNRSWSTQALVLALHPFGEGHREALLLTKENGLVRATVFGGAKSKLRALVSPYQTGTVWLYTDPVKKSTKITDFDVVSCRQGIRENLVRSWCAALCVEIVTRSHGNSDWRLVNAFLDGISVSGEDECRRGLLRYLWRSLSAAGLAPEMDSCVRCGKKTTNGIVYYSHYEDACICADCARNEETRFPVSPAGAAYLKAAVHAEPHAARVLPLGEEDFANLRLLLFFLVSRMVDGPLKTLETGEGII